MNKNKFFIFLLMSILLFTWQLNAKEQEKDVKSKKVSVKKETTTQKVNDEKNIKPETNNDSPVINNFNLTPTPEVDSSLILEGQNSTELGEELNWYVFPSGVSVGTTGDLVLESITGQEFVGNGTSPQYNISYGFWQTFELVTCCIGIRGNVDDGPDDGGYLSIDVADLVRLAVYILNNEPPPNCLIEADVDGSGEIDIADIVYLVQFMFNGGPTPPACP